jgi:NADP-dependent 3-hydroxy acid dehydrogenase YdfG
MPPLPPSGPLRPPRAAAERVQPDPTGVEQWTDAVALVTGASSGIGEALCARLVDAGLRVAGCARRAEPLAALRDQLGGRFHPIVCDLRDEAAILRMFAEVATVWGGVDVLINNAGVGHLAPLAHPDTPAEHWRELLEVNVLALSVCTREALAQMHARGRGHVVHISSLSGHRVPAGGGGMYAATKHAVRALTEALRVELLEAGSPVRVTSVSPGVVRTGFAAQIFPDDPAAAAEVYSRFPVLHPDDVAEAVLYALAQPAHVAVHDVLLRPTRQPT